LSVYFSMVLGWKGCLDGVVLFPMAFTLCMRKEWVNASFGKIWFILGGLFSLAQRFRLMYFLLEMNPGVCKFNFLVYYGILSAKLLLM